MKLLKKFIVHSAPPTEQIPTKYDNLPADRKFEGETCPSSHLLVKRATKMSNVPARDMTYHSTVRTVQIMVHIFEVVVFCNYETKTGYFPNKFKQTARLSL